VTEYGGHVCSDGNNNFAELFVRFQVTVCLDVA
jgi:hypothetical protein